LGLLALRKILRYFSAVCLNAPQSAQINVPQVSFLASLGTQIIKTAQAQLAYGFNQHWQLALSANYQHYGYGQSTLSNGFIEPESMTKQRSVLTSLHYIY
jgi:hypothetical protein